MRDEDLESVSDFYKLLFGNYVSASIDSSNVNPDAAAKAHQLGAIFAEFGIAPGINEKDNPIKLRSIYQPAPIL